MMKISSLLILFAFAVNNLDAQLTDKLSDEQILKLYEPLRVADVSDGMDFVGLRNAGLMNQSIVPLWRDINDFSHRISGIAVTARYIPTNKVVKNPMPYDEYKSWEGNWYSKIAQETFGDSLKPGKVIVIDCQGDGDVGSVGSFNALDWYSKGARGIVSGGGVRDIDELILQKIPVYIDPLNRGRGIRPGRNELESVNKPVTVGGVLVRPGDVIVADSDGVIVVPREYAVQVAEYGHKILVGDKEGRKRLYEKMKRPMDKTVTD